METTMLQTRESRISLIRIILVEYEVFPEIMKELLLNSISPRTLFNIIQNDKKMMEHLNPKEQKIVKGMYDKGYADVDVSFAYKLFRYKNLESTPTQNWGREPRSGDFSVSDDIERIHRLRNSLCHRASQEVSKKELEKYFVDVIAIGKRVDEFLKKNSGFGFYEKILSIQRNSIDAETEEKYKNAVREIDELKCK